MASLEPRTLSPGRAALGDRDKPPSPAARPVLKRCPGCGETKLLDDFALNRSTKDGHQGYCKPCGAERTRQYREKHPETPEQAAHKKAYMKARRDEDVEAAREQDKLRYARDRDVILQRKRERYANDEEKRAREIASTNRSALRRRKLFIAELAEIRGSLGCTSCGLQHGKRLVFHHIDPTTKSFSVGNGVGERTRGAVLDELLKCIVLCTPCHVRLHVGKVALTAAEVEVARLKLERLAESARDSPNHSAKRH